jgi:hypothetical protein
MGGDVTGRWREDAGLTGGTADDGYQGRASNNRLARRGLAVMGGGSADISASYPIPWISSDETLPADVGTRPIPGPGAQAPAAIRRRPKPLYPLKVNVRNSSPKYSLVL